MIENEKHAAKSEELSGFTVPMAVMDMVPVAFFSVSVSILSGRFVSSLFAAGAVLVILAGALKVLWKFILAIAKRDVHFLNRQMRYVMPAGFVLMVIALAVDRDAWSMRAVAGHVLSFPAIIFFVFAVAEIICMAYFAKHFNSEDAKANWIEQGTNALAQFFFMMGILL